MLEILTILGVREDPSLMLMVVKYLHFDLEATRRENEYLRNMLAQDQTGNN